MHNHKHTRFCIFVRLCCTILYTNTLLCPIFWAGEGDGLALVFVNTGFINDVYRFHILFCVECEKLIRRMLQLEPGKRIPLNKVLEHRWMLGVEPVMPHTMNFEMPTTSDKVVWNTQVLSAIQNMNYDVERCKQVSDYFMLKINEKHH